MTENGARSRSMAANNRTTLFAALGIVAALAVGGAAVAVGLAVKATRPDAAATANASAAILPAFDNGSAAEEPLGNPVASLAVPATAPLATTISAVGGAVRLPVPQDLPADAYADTPDQSIGSIVIPRLGVDETLHVGMTLTALNRGPSQWPGTALPGQLGNVVVGGHRTTYGRPFRDLDKLIPGDLVLYRTPTGEFPYTVRSIEIVDPNQLTIADQTPAFTSTLFACHPPGSAEFRIVAHLELLGPDGKPLPVGPVQVLNGEEITRFRTT